MDNLESARRMLASGTTGPALCRELGWDSQQSYNFLSQYAETFGKIPYNHGWVTLWVPKGKSNEFRERLEKNWK